MPEPRQGPPALQQAWHEEETVGELCSVHLWIIADGPKPFMQDSVAEYTLKILHCRRPKSAIDAAVGGSKGVADASRIYPKGRSTVHIREVDLLRNC